MKTIQTLALLLALVIGAVLQDRPAQAAPTTDLLLQVDRLLSGFEPIAKDVQAGLLRLGPSCAEVLIAMARDTQLSPIKRLRAIEALGYVPTPSGLSYLRQLAMAKQHATDAISVYELTAAVAGLAGFGPAAMGDISSFLSHKSVDVREAAARSVGQVRTAEAERLLKVRLDVERDATVRGLLQRILSTRLLAR